MPRQQGDGKGRLGGRQKGTPNKTTSTAKERLANIVDDYYNSSKFKRDLKELEPLDRIKVMEKLTAYVVPKQQAVSAQIDYTRLSDEQLDYVIAGLTADLNEEETDSTNSDDNTDTY